MNHLIYNIFFFIGFFLSSNNFSYCQTSIYLKKEGGVFTVPCSVNGVDLKFIFDTGASNVSISSTEANFLFKNGYLTKNDILGSERFSDATGKISIGTIINIKKLEFSNIILYDVEATIVDSQTAPLLLGQTALAKIGKFTFDPISGELILLENSKKVSVNNYDNKNNDIISRNYGLSAESKYNSGDYIGAILDFTKAIELTPNRSILYYQRGNSKWLLKDYYGSILDSNKAIELNPQFSAAYTIRGNCYSALNKNKEAFSDFTRAIELDKDNPHAYYNRGIIYYWVYKKKYEACMDWSKAGELGYSEAYTLIKQICN